MKARCDGCFEIIHYDGFIYAYRCECKRCERETPDERFHACDGHQEQAGVQHERVRGYASEWLWSSFP